MEEENGEILAQEMRNRPRTSLHHPSLLSAIALRNVLLEGEYSCLLFTLRGFGKPAELAILILVGGGNVSCSAPSASVGVLWRGS